MISLTKADLEAAPDVVTVQLRDAAVAATTLPESVLHYVLRSRDSVILDMLVNASIATEGLSVMGFSAGAATVGVPATR